MNKAIKIILIIILVIFILSLAMVGLGLYISYQDYKWHEGAKNMGPILFGSQPFNERLSSCLPSWGGQSIGESWEIIGLVKDNCIVKLTEPNIREEEGDAYPIKIDYTTYSCRLLKEIYSKPENIGWSEDIFQSEYCKVI